MVVNSKHPGDIMNWIKKCIDSCIKPEQYQACYELLKIFYNQYISDLPFTDEYRAEYCTLENYLDDKYWEDKLIKLEKQK